MVAVPELLQPAATTPKNPIATIPLSPAQIPSSYPPTALQLSLLAAEAEVVPAGQAEGHVREVGVVNPGPPRAHEAAAAPAAETAAAAVSMFPEAAAASPGARRPVFEIQVDSTAASAGMAVVALVRCSADEGSAESMPGQLSADMHAGVSNAKKDVLEDRQSHSAKDACRHSAGGEDATQSTRSVAEERVSAAAAFGAAPADGDDLHVSGSLLQ